MKVGDIIEVVADKDCRGVPCDHCVFKKRCDNQHEPCAIEGAHVHFRLLRRKVETLWK